MMREKFNALVMQEASCGFQRGIELFLEELNDNIERDALIDECGIDAVLDRLVMMESASRK